MSTPWWQTRAYRDPVYRYAMIEQDRRTHYLMARAFDYRNHHPLSKLGASLAIAGAAAASQMTWLSLPRALELLRYYEAAGWRGAGPF